MKNKYIIKLIKPLNKSISEKLKQENIDIIFSDELIPDEIVVLSKKTIDELRKIEFISDIRFSRIGRLLKNNSLPNLRMSPPLEDDINLLSSKGYYGLGAKVAILDSGIDKKLFSQVIETKDFTGFGEMPLSEHGNVVTSIIKKLSRGSCIYSGKVCHFEDRLEEDHLLMALKWARSLNVNVINISAGFDFNCDGTCILCRYINAIFEKHGTLTIAAVGNDGDSFTYCPASANDAISVGCLTKDGKGVADFSTPGNINLNKPNLVMQGCGIIYLPSGSLEFSGTSFSAPVLTGIIASLVLNYALTDKLKLSILMAAEPLENVSVKKQGLGRFSLTKLVEVLEKDEKIYSTGTENG